VGAAVGTHVSSTGRGWCQYQKRPSRGGPGLAANPANEATESVSAEDFLDDGTPLRLRVSVRKSSGSALLDFEGTGCEDLGNLNPPL